MHRTLLACMITIASGSTAKAADGFTPQFMTTLKVAAETCSGSNQTLHADGRKTTLNASDLIASISASSRPAASLSGTDANNLYHLAKGLLLPSLASKNDGIIDGTSFAKCASAPDQGLAVMQYLAGEKAIDLRGMKNVYSWLGVAYREGIGAPADPRLSRKWFLKFKIATGVSEPKFWADGVDQDLYGNLMRQGLEPFLNQFAATENGDAARRILAEHVLKHDPEQARRLLHDVHLLSLRRLLELERNGVLPPIYNVDELGFWVLAATAYPEVKGVSERLITTAANLNGGNIPVSSERPSVKQLLPNMKGDDFAQSGLDQSPVPLRLLIDPSGKPLIVQPCALRVQGSIQVATWRGATTVAVRMFAPDKLPTLKPTNLDGKPSYAWVILPAVRFSYPTSTKFKIEFLPTSPVTCS